MTQFNSALIDLQNDDSIGAIQKADTLCNLSQGFARAVNANEKLMPTVNQYAIAESTIVQLAAYIAKQQPNLVADFSQLLDDFLSTLTFKD